MASPSHLTGWLGSVRAMVLLTLSIGLGLPSILLLHTGLNAFDDEFLAQLRVQHEAMANILARSLSSPVWDMDEEEIRAQLDQFAQNPGILSVELSPFNNDYLPQIFTMPKPRQGASSWVMARPILHDGEIIAQLVIDVSLDQARQITQKMRKELQWLFTALLLLVWAVMTALLYRRVLNPLHHLAQAADRVADGDLQTSLQRTGQDEIAVLSKALDRMRQSLQRQLEQIESKNLTLYDQLKENKANIEALVQRDRDIQRLIQLHDGLLTLLRGGQQHMDGPQIMRAALTSLTEAAHYPQGAVLHVDMPVDSLIPLATLPCTEIPTIQGFAMRALLRSFASEDVIAVSRIEDHSALAVLGEQMGWKPDHSCLAAPIYLDGAVYGILCLSGSHQPCQDGDRQLIQMAATLLALLLEQSRRWQSESKLRVLSCAVEQSPAAVIITDPKGLIEYVNPRFSDVTGYGLDEVRGRSPSVLRSTATPDAQYHSLWQTISRGGLWSGEMVNRRKDGSEYYVRSSISPILDSDGTISHYVGVHDDLTELRQRQEELRLAKEQAEAGNHAKSMFLANTSHEIRTPMNAIIGMSHLALEEELAPQVRTYVQNIHDAGQMLLRVINDILDFSKIEAGKLDLEMIPFRLHEALQSVLKVVDVRAKEKKLAVELDIDPSTPIAIKGDPARLSQVLINLIGNAVKFTEQGFIRIRVSATTANDGRSLIQIEVQDSGIGISPDQQKLLFQPFSQADWSMARRFGGTGLGLSISRRLVEMMGGRIWLDSIPGQGSTFSFTLLAELVDAPAPRSQRPKTAPQNLSLPPDFRLLVAEDNDLNRQLVRGLLARANITPDFAENGQIALDMLHQAEQAQRPYDMVFMDVQMPVMDGMEATQAIRQIPAFATLPIVALTAHALGEERERFLQCGMNDHMAKPLKPQELYGKLQEWAGRRRAEDSAKAEAEKNTSQ